MKICILNIRRLIANKHENIPLVNYIKSDYADIEDDFCALLLKEDIEHILNNSLTSKDRARNKIIFKLYFYECFTPDEIAEILGLSISAKTVSNIVSRLKNILREELFKQKMETIEH